MEMSYQGKDFLADLKVSLSMIGRSLFSWLEGGPTPTLEVPDAVQDTISELVYIVIGDYRKHLWELLIPEQGGPHYLLVFKDRTLWPSGRSLRESALFRITDSGQSYLGIVSEPGQERLTQRLRDAYDRAEPIERHNVSVPKSYWDWRNCKRSVDHDKMITLAVYNRPGLADVFEELFQKSGLVEAMESKGAEDLQNKLTGIDLNNMLLTMW